MIGCADCGLEYGGEGWVEGVIPDKIWNKIRPEQCDEGCGILCIACMVRRLRMIIPKEIKVPIWICGTEPLCAINGDPMDNIDIVRNWDI